MKRILSAYLKRLTNLSTRNKSLLLPSLPSEQFLDLSDVDFLLGKPAFTVMEQLVQRKPRIPICDLQDPRFARVNEISRKLRKIARTDFFIQEERGSQDLYVGYPFVRGKLSDGTPIHAPLLFFPVTLKTDREQWCLFAREESEMILNRSFTLAYAYFNEVVIPDDVLDKSFEDFSRDFLEFRTQLHAWLKETPLRINFNQELFENKLIPFEARKGAELQLVERNGALKLFQEAVLGIFPQAGSYLVPDYETLIDRIEQHPFHILLQDNSGGPYADMGPLPSMMTDAKSKEEDILTPFSMDESQERIIRAVKTGESVVVQGPPGSGKSQLICNLMADFTARGKRVLLVCQKRAALDVVHERLKTIGMDPFVALIHDFKNDRSELYRQFASQVGHIDLYRQRNYSLDAVFMERQFTQHSRNIDRIVEELDSFRDALFDEKECGVSVKELYLTSDYGFPHLDLGDQYRFFRMDRLDDFLGRLNSYTKYFLAIGSDHFWYQRKSFAAWGPGALRSVEKMIQDWPNACHKQIETFTSVTGSFFVTDLIVDKNEALERLRDIAALLTDGTTFALFKAYLKTNGNIHERLAFIRQTTDSLGGFFEGEGVEFSMDGADLSIFRTQLKKVLEAKKSAISGIWWNVFGAGKQMIQSVATNNGLDTSYENLLILEVKVRNRIELENWLQNHHLRFEASFLEPSQEFESQYLQFFQRAERAADAASRAGLKPWAAILERIAGEAEDISLFKNRISQLIDWIQTWSRLEETMTPFLLAEQITQLLEDPVKASEAALLSLRRDFDSLVDMDRLREDMNIHERTVTDNLLAEAGALGVTDSVDILSLFNNSVRLGWIEHIETKFPHLSAVSSHRMEQWEKDLQHSITEKQNLSVEIVALRLREHTYEGIENNRLGNRVTYRELNHQVSKKRKIWPIRKLLDSYSQEMFSLVPCWMASPEAVSAIFPMQAGLFDLVIFDEASQCYAENGIPAAFRGKQIVVTGDNKQLAPNDLYKTRYEEKADEDTYSVALEIESLLDLAAQSMKQYQLSGHYRSLSLDLIDFSNQHFYNNTLRLLPDFSQINSSEPGIKYIKVAGVWKDNANLVEVQSVISLLRELDGSDRRVGVVTFNFYQQQAIQDAIEKEPINIRELFVKNIENVQGDERDVIIFSMGYAVNEHGKLSMQFGSLNAKGGENRLNVAVTRARERIYFVTSLWPDELNTDLTAHEGPKLLKAYLRYALDVSDGKFRSKPIPSDHIRTDWLLKNRLLKLGENIGPDLPFSDLAVKKEGAYERLILTDDDLYYHAASSKEPHAYLPLLLQKKHWLFTRVYSRQFWTKTLKF